MRGRWMLVAMAIPAIVAAVALYLAVDNIAQAGPGGAPAAAPSVPTVISYQGRLTDPGTGQPKADGNYNMRFRIYDAATAGAVLWQEPAAADPAASVPVAGGVFTRLLGSSVALNASVFSGGSAYLEVEVGGETLSPRQQIGAVAYALVAETLSAPASLSGDVASPDALLTVNNAGTGFGGFFSSAADHLDLALGGAVGRINTDPSDENSDLILSSNNDIHLRLDNDSGEDGVLRVKNSGGTDVCTVDESGNLSCQGALISAFPRPAYDSGYVAVAKGTDVTRNHNLGGDPASYVALVDCTSGGGTYIPGPLRWDEGGAMRGFYVRSLTSTEVMLRRADDDGFCDGGMRVRIWIVK